ncbi:uncharacterized protein LAJ45_09922 [Morchella importuna]|uniref:uncharacterized protein n=1 Tax=Morchella importuna TaxID=1174673 RepID=UPI001E8DF4A3|nr:uncharacterized protein LAJ45_09922 [Morchella importuna]KAH8146000.1 hypothetical protein LAJ45_09922 [Morchella importuna]
MASGWLAGLRHALTTNTPRSNSSSNRGREKEPVIYLVYSTPDNLQGYSTVRSASGNSITTIFPSGSAVAQMVARAAAEEEEEEEEEEVRTRERR